MQEMVREASEMEEPILFGQWLRKRRRGLDLTQAELARRAGCAPITIKKLESNQLRPSKDLAGAVIRQLGVGPADVDALVRFARGGPDPGSTPRVSPSGNLPIERTSFIGRERQVAEVCLAIQEHRLVTLVAPGGAGKTRLALEAAEAMLDQFPDGAWFVDLEPISDPALISQAVARVFRLSDGPGRRSFESLSEYLAGRCLLLVLDKCEHLLDDCSHFTDAILRAAAHVKVLATSREALHLPEELVYRVPSLNAPDIHHLPAFEQLTQFESMRLFIERAVLATSSFTVTNENAPAMAEICQRLDGIPLAIELAAARVNSLPVEAISTRLEDRFRLISGGSRNALPQQQILRATIDWSYAMLSPAEKSLLQRLSVFRGGWTADTAEMTYRGGDDAGGDVASLLPKLVNRAMISVDDRARYRMTETVRQYAAEKLMDSEQAGEARDCHLKAILALAEEAEPEIRGGNQILWLDRLDAEVDNLWVAIQWAQERDSESFLRLASALWLFCQIRLGGAEQRDWLFRALILTRHLRSLPRARALARAAYLVRSTSGPEHDDSYAQQAYKLGAELHDQLSTAMALSEIGLSKLHREPDTALTNLQEALGLAKELGEQWLMTEILGDLGWAAQLRNDLDAAQSFFHKAIQQTEISEDRRAAAFCMSTLAFLHLAQGDSSQAERLLQQAWTLTMQLGDKANMLTCRMQGIRLEIFRENYLLAEQLLEDASHRGSASGANRDISSCLMYSALLDCAQGNYSRSAESCQTALKLAQQGGSSFQVSSIFIVLADASRGMGRYDHALDAYRQALMLAQQEGFSELYCPSLQGLACLALVQGQAERAVRLFAGRARLREAVFAEDFFPFMVRERERLMAEARGQLGEKRFKAVWAAAQAMSQAEMLAYALIRPEA